MNNVSKILFITIGNEKSASSRVYVYQYLSFLHKDQIGSEIINFGPHQNNPYNKGILRYATALKFYFSLFLKVFILNFRVLLTSRNYDVIFCQKVVLLPWVARKLKSRIIYCIDDAVYLKKNKLTIGVLSNSAYYNFLDQVDRMVVGSEDYFELLSRYKHKMYYVPNAVNIVNTNNEAEKSKVTLGWIGSPNTTKYLDLIRDALNSLLENYGEVVRVVLIGADSIKHKKIPAATYQDWSLEDESKLLSQLDVGLMPLMDDEWERGKCGYKIIQYFSHGIPALASPVGINKRLINNSSGGYLCNNNSQWLERLIELIQNKEKRKQMGQNALRYASENHKLKKVYETRYKPALFNEK